MVFRDLLRDTLRTLAQHKLRTLLTMFGIAWGIVSITLMVAAGEGLRVGQAKVAESFGQRRMIVFAGRTSLQVGGTRAGRQLQWTATDHVEVQPHAPSCAPRDAGAGPGDVPVRSSYNGASRSSSPARCRPSPRSAASTSPRDATRTGTTSARPGGSPSSATTPRSSSSPAAPRSGRRSGSADFPYTVVGVARPKEQDTNYDGPDMGKVFVPFGAILRDLPNRPPRAARRRGPAARDAALARRARGVQGRGPAGPRPAPRVRPPGQGGGPHLGHGRAGARRSSR